MSFTQQSNNVVLSVMTREMKNILRREEKRKERVRYIHTQLAYVYVILWSRRGRYYMLQSIEGDEEDAEMKMDSLFTLWIIRIAN